MLKRKQEKLEQSVSKAAQGQMGLIWFRFKKNKLAVFGLTMLVIIYGACLLSLFFIPEERAISQNLSKAHIPPFTEGYILGTDMFGRDLFARILRGGAVSLSAGLTVIGGALCLGIIFGSIAGYFGGKVDFYLMRFLDILSSIPHLLLTMTLIVALGQSTGNLLLAMSLSFFPGLARMVRSSIMTIRENEYVDAAKCYGASTVKILLQHILPNGIGPVVISTTLMLGNVILSIAGLGFLGVGITPPTPEWGTILSEVRDYIRFYPYMGIIPGLAIGTGVLCINFIGDGFRDALDPRTKK